jgi:hypothetical protein
MADLDKTDPLASMLGDGYTNLDKAGKVAAAGSFLKSRDEAEKAARGEAGKRAEGQIISEFGPSLYSKPYEEFKPSQESLSGFAALGSLMMVAGTMMGSNGRLAGIGAMNNIAGMLKGYQQGRKDLYEQERQQFEENMKIQERNRADIKEAFNLALKMAPTNLRGAEDFLNKTFASKGMTMPQAMLKTSGVMHTIGTVNGALDKADNITKQIAESLGYKGVTSRKDLEARIAAQAAGTAAQSAAEEAALKKRKELATTQLEEKKLSGSGLTPEQQFKKDQTQAWADNLYDQFQKTGKPPVLKTMEEQQAYAYLHKGAPFVTTEDAGEKKLQPIKGQVRYVSNFIGKDEAESLGEKQIPTVGSTLEAATLAYKLSAAIKETPEAAGALSNVYNWIDKYRINKPQDMEVNPQVLANSINSDKSVFIDPKTGKDFAPDKIARIREINKLAVDVINARALAASQGTRLLISELNMQKGVIDPANMSAQSAFLVFKDLADRDLQSLERQGLSDKGIERAKTRARMRGEGKPIPTRQQFLEAAKKVNPNYTDEELNSIYSDKYGED